MGTVMISRANIHINYKIFIKKHVQYYYKKMHNSIPIQVRCMKFNIQVFPYLLNNLTYAPFACLVWPKCSNYVVNVKNKSCFSIIQKIMHNFISIQARHTKIKGITYHVIFSYKSDG